MLVDGANERKAALTDADAHRAASDDLERFLVVGVAVPQAGVYSSFLRHAEAAAKKYDLKTVDILVELGARKMVGGQEDMIVDVALDLLRKTKHERAHAEPIMSEAA